MKPLLETLDSCLAVAPTLVRVAGDLNASVDCWSWSGSLWLPCNRKQDFAVGIKRAS